MKTWKSKINPFLTHNPEEFSEVLNYKLKDPKQFPYSATKDRIVTAMHYLNGEPNNPASRTILAQNGLVKEGTDFLVINNQIYPMWALLEATVLKNKYPEYFE
jgi:arabinogalactan endo-1,4-beta-galactosidase